MRHKTTHFLSRIKWREIIHRARQHALIFPPAYSRAREDSSR